MTAMKDHLIYAEDETGRPTEQWCARAYPASDESVALVLAASEDEDGRSNWMWLRLANGSLVLGVFPQGETYFATENDHIY